MRRSSYLWPYVRAMAVIRVDDTPVLGSVLEHLASLEKPLVEVFAELCDGGH